MIKKQEFFRAILIKLLIITLYTISNNPKYLIIFYGIGTVFIFVEFFDRIYVKNRLIITFHTKATFVFLVICTFSLFWSIEPAYDYYKFLLFNFFLMFAFNNYVDSREKLDETFKGFIVAGIAMSLHILLVSRGNLGSYERLLIEGYNSNSVGLYLGFSILISMYFFEKYQNIKYLIPTVLFIPIIFFSGSKKSFFLLVFIIIFYSFFKKRRVTKKVKNTMLAFFLVSIVLYLASSIPWAYDILWSRVLDLYNSIVSDKPGQDYIRFFMVELGIEIFKEKPIIGHGLGNYRIFLDNAIGFRTYSHNNYIELLTGVGILGFVSYYIIYMHIIKRLIKRYSRDTTLVGFLLTIMIGVTLLDLVVVSFYVSFFQLLITLSFIGLKIMELKTEKSIDYKKRMEF